MTEQLTRRRFIALSAAAGGLALLPPGAARAAARPEVVTWRGTVLGAVATFQIHHHDRAAGEHLVARALAEVRRLEGLFSLYRADSLLVALNRQGALAAPPADFMALLEDCRRFAELTDGAFDPTVQPLWRLYADHFARPGADPAGPGEEAVSAALARVGHVHLLVGRDRVAFARRGMALTLNGIAQGFVTDHVVDLLRAEGIAHSLVDMGEVRALGPRPDGRPWAVGIADPSAPGALAATLPLTDRAVATSAPSGFRFDPGGAFHHLFDPRTGRSPGRYASVTVVMPTATEADALSTAFSLMAPDDIRRVLGRIGHGTARLTLAEGGVMEVAGT
ncbi:FAD:protein FMN transferase [Chelatococcus sp. SYSU_G07232]|uniref:FAD:protein FMN transferase n=1 Tax=Chelatococcus albus TaxID=3047466 RepID=A0ABT7AFU0_9HYPH|nr:FAD:protein FMN transferase [Chelatococcus sp. SYSU_G07232]MDJ1158198.1 FAD:protein FMN transferase [Chelatococcus sp. SYSU_G07232]